MIKAVDQEIYDALYIELNTNDKVYTKQPPDDAKYPYYHMGMLHNQSNVAKCLNRGIMNATIHVWSDERFEASRLSEKALEYARGITFTERFNWLLNGKASNYRVLEDNTTNSTLYHGVVELEYKYIERR